MRTMRLIVALSCCGAAHAFGPAIGAASVAGFLGWAFQGVGPSKDAAKVCRDAGPSKIRGLNRALLFGNGEPAVALYCGTKVRKASYAPLACAISEKLGGDGVLVLQSPLNVYAFKPATVEKVLDRYPSVRCVAGHSIGGLWAVEFCRDLVAAGKWPENGLSFYYMGVHGRGVSLEPFRGLPFDKVGWSCATEDVTMQRCIDDEGCDTSEEIAEAYIAEVKEQLPDGAVITEIAGGNHEQYGSYGSPGYSKGLAYKDLIAKISAEDQCAAVAAAIAATATKD